MPRYSSQEFASRIEWRSDKADAASRVGMAFAETFAQELNHITATVATNAGQAMPRGSIAERLRAAFSDLDADRQEKMRLRAEELLTGRDAMGRAFFGRHAESGPDAWRRRGSGLEPDVAEMLKHVVRERMEGHRHEIERNLSALAEGLVHHPVVPAGRLVKTSLEVGHFSGDVQAAWKELTLHQQPGPLHFRWKTKEGEAEQGVWQLVRAAGKEEVLITTGWAGKAPGGIFRIDMGAYLPIKPSDVPAVYRVRVLPGTKMTYKTTPSQTAHETVVEKVPGKPVGFPSNAVTITYSASTDPPFMLSSPLEVYRQLGFQLKEIHLIQDQPGPGAEEFHIAGFVQEILPLGSGKAAERSKFKRFAQLHPDGPTYAPIGHNHLFWLNNPASGDWPRTYIAVISILEEDSGNLVTDWLARVAAVAEQALKGNIHKAVQEFIATEYKQLIDEIDFDDVKSAGEYGYAVAQLVAAIAGTVVAVVVGWVLLVAAMFVFVIWLDSADDYYGIEVAVLPMPTNNVDVVHFLPGKLSDSGKTYVLKTERLRFRHPPYHQMKVSVAQQGMLSHFGLLKAQGIVDVTLDWFMTRRELV